MLERKKNPFVRTTKPTLQLQNALCNIAQNFLHIHTFLKNELLPTTVVQQTRQVDAVGCSTFLVGRTACFVSLMFDF
jgi:hypothetical protein